MSDTLQQELQQLLRTDAANAALTQLLDDYRRYHLVLVIVGSLFLIAALVLSVYSWRRFAKAPRSSRWRWTFERWTYFGFGVLGLIVAAFLALVVAANISNVVNPRAGFTGALGLLGSPSPGSNFGQVQQAYSQWLQSGAGSVPPAVQAAVDDRLSWQQPKAIYCTMLLIVFVGLALLVWSRLIRLSRVHEPRRLLLKAVLLLAGIFTVVGSLLLMLMVMGNVQTAFAPLAMTMFYG